MSEINEELAELTQANGERLQRLQQYHKVTVNTQVLILRHLIETLFPTEEERHELDLSFQARLSTVLDETEAQLDRVTLQQTGPNGSGLFVPGA